MTGSFSSCFLRSSSAMSVAPSSFSLQTVASSSSSVVEGAALVGVEAPPSSSRSRSYEKFCYLFGPWKE